MAMRGKFGPTRFRPFDVVVLAAGGLLVLPGPLSVRDAAWVPDLAVVPNLAVAGLLVGYLVERTRLPAALGTLLGLLLGIEAVAWVYAGAVPGGSLTERVTILLGQLGNWFDLVLTGGVSNDALVFALAMGALAWVLGLVTAWLLFRDAAPWLALALNGVALFMNLSYAPASLVSTYVTWFVLAGCFTLAVQQLAVRQELWRRAQLSVAPRVVFNVLLGTAVAAGALLSMASALPSSVTSPQIAVEWTRATSPWQNLETEFDRWFAALNGNGRTARGLSFGRTLAPRGSFDLGDTPVLQVRPADPNQRLYLRATTADRYAGQAITSSETSTSTLDANTDLVPAEALPDGRTLLPITIRVLASRTAVAFGPDAPVRFSLPTEVEMRGNLTSDIATIRLDSAIQQNQEYSVTSAIPVATTEQLRTAGEEYPDWVRSRYLQLPRGLPRRVIDSAHEQTAGKPSAFDKATGLEAYLRANFTYSTHVPEVPQGRDWVDYFLFDSQQGYCDYFATAMTVLLRVEGVPARVASGFAPGDQESDGTYTVRENHAHSWVEVYFPRYGWIVFEPSAIRPLPERPEQAAQPAPAAQAPASDLASSGDLTAAEQDELRSLREGAGQGSASRPFLTTWPGILLLILAILLVGAVLGLIGAALVWRRKLGRLAIYQRPFAQLVQLGRWFGVVRPAVSDTPYEIAHALSRQVPSASRTVDRLTSAYVEGTYASRPPSGNPWPEWLAARRRLATDLARERLRRALRRRSADDAD
jgi:transglutaminase-like putative cysteine protease